MHYGRLCTKHFPSNNVNDQRCIHERAYTFIINNARKVIVLNVVGNVFPRRYSEWRPFSRFLVRAPRSGPRR